MNDTATRSLADILAVVDDNRADLLSVQEITDEDNISSERDAYLGALENLAEAVRAQLAPLPEGDTEAMAAEAEAAARTMAPPVPGVTVKAGYTVHSVIYRHPHEGGLLETWIVAAENPERGTWATWNACALDHPGREGTLAYDTGHYFEGPDRDGNKRHALADMVIRAGLTVPVALHIADDITNPRLARQIRAYFAS